MTNEQSNTSSASELRWMPYEDWLREKEWMAKAERKMIRETLGGSGLRLGLLDRFILMATRQQTEKDLEVKYLNQIISYKAPKGNTIIGKVMRISYWPKDKVDYIHVQIANTVYNVELDYFLENTTIL